MSSGIKVNLDSVLIFTLGFGFSFLEPLDERLSLLMDLGCCFLGNILLRRPTKRFSTKRGRRKPKRNTMTG